jgi:hypothetical protein
VFYKTGARSLDFLPERRQTTTCRVYLSEAHSQFTQFAVSRDGTRLALARGKTTSDVVLIRDLR